MSDFFSKAHELLSRGVPFATATVVRAEKPTSAKPGDKAIVTAEGVLYGWIGGSCAQPTVIREALKALEDGDPRFIRLSTNPGENQRQAGIIDLLMTCFSGGTLEIYIEPQLPTPRLMVIGSLPVAQALVRLGKSMHYHVVAVDPDTRGASLPEADEVITDLKEIPSRVTQMTYIVVASHGNYDEAALELALATQADYIGLVSSKKRAATVIEYLKAQGLPEAAIKRLKYPAGLDIHAMQGEEIALSILAEIVQRRHKSPAGAAPQSPAKPRKVFDLAAPKPVEPGTFAGSLKALDPVCGMEVQVEAAKHYLEQGGTTYYFCCKGCLKAFTAEPEKYLGKPAPTGEALDPVCGMTVDIATAHYISEFEGRLYYFCAAGCKLAFERAHNTYLHPSDAR
jgi:xanthine dehydrogenase accessory factor